MITGLHFDVTTDELREHCNKMLAHHEEKVAFYETKLVGVNDLMENFNQGGSMNQDPRKTFQDKVREHREKISSFTFIRDHLIANETYRMTGNELKSLDIITSYFYN